MTQPNFIWKKPALDYSDGNRSHVLIYMRYGNKNAHKFFLDFDRERAETKMTQFLNDRTEFEKQDEGWDVECFELVISSEGTAFMAENFQDQVGRLLKNIL